MHNVGLRNFKLQIYLYIQISKLFKIHFVDTGDKVEAQEFKKKVKLKLHIESNQVYIPKVPMLIHRAMPTQKYNMNVIMV